MNNQVWLAQLHSAKLPKVYGKRIWNVDKFLAQIPEGAVKSWKSCMLIWKQPILPKRGIGIDPGLRCGLAFIEAPYTIFTLSLYINRAGLSSVQLLDVLQKVSILFPSLSTDIPVVVEGASYNARFGQVILAEARAGLIMGMSNRGFKNVVEMPPRSIRKVTFGNGNVQPKEFWADHMRAVGKDGLDAASMAIAAGEG